ncbi:MAG: MTH1187 family thiamine-binding protein [Thermoproteota archaeon]
MSMITLAMMKVGTCISFLKSIPKNIADPRWKGVKGISSVFYCSQILIFFGKIFILEPDSKPRMAIVVELSIVPLGEGTSVSKILAYAIKELENMGIKYEVTPMCTVFEADSIEEALRIVKTAHESIFKQGVKRVITTVRIDDRRDVKRSMSDRVESLRRAVESV